MKTFTKTMLAVALGCATTSAIAQDAETTEAKEKKVEFSVGADAVSSYVWRGLYCGSVAVQPTVEMTAGGFTLGSWGSIGINTGDTKEFDFYASYQVKAFSFGVTDYFITDSWDDHSYFAKGSHGLEANLGWDFAEICDKFAMTISANMNFLNDKKIDEKGKEKENFSTYLELGYPVESKIVNWDFALGAALNESAAYGSNGFSVINVSAKASKDIAITEKFALPLFAQMVLNPRQERVHFIVGLSF